MRSRQSRHRDRGLKSGGTGATRRNEIASGLKRQQECMKTNSIDTSGQAPSIAQHSLAIRGQQNYLRDATGPLRARRHRTAALPSITITHSVDRVMFKVEHLVSILLLTPQLLQLIDEWRRVNMPTGRMLKPDVSSRS